MDRRTFLRMTGGGLAAAALAPACGQTTSTLAAKPGPGKFWDDPMFSHKLLIAHRGASAYAPENTIAAYELAIKQGATLVEQDLNITKDGQLVCIHDGSLQATTDVEEVFPDRFTERVVQGKKGRAWMVSDFTLAEIRQLKAGFRTDAKNVPEGVPTTTIPTWQEAIDAIRGKAGLCPETKSEGYYKKLGFNMEKMVADVLKKNGLDKPGADSRTPVLLQSFDKNSLGNMKANGVDLPMIWLHFYGTKNLESRIPEAVKLGFAAMGPCKIDMKTPAFIEKCHAAGLRVIEYTYDAAYLPEGIPNITVEMSQHLYDFGVDGMFTNNPDMFPKAKV